MKTPKLLLFSCLFLLLLVSGSTTYAENGNCNLNGFVTFTQGGWGTKASGNNPGTVRDMYFSSVFPTGLVVGGKYTLKLTTSAAVKDFLPQGGPSDHFDHSYTDVTSTSAGVLAGQVVALTLNVYFDDFGSTGTNVLKLKDLVITSGTFKGKTVSQFLAIANTAIGGGTTSYSFSDINDAATAINENFDNGTTNNGFLTCPAQPASIGDKVWLDTDKDGIQDSGEPGVAGVTVQLYNCSGSQVIAEVQTDASGLYHFTGLNAGDYKIKFVLPANYIFTQMNAGSDDSKDSDADLTSGFTACYTLTAGQTNNTADAGIYVKPVEKAAIGNLVWNDLNKNGVQDAGEPGLSGVTVELYNCSGNTAIKSTTTNSNGIYSFTDLTPGDYKVKFNLPANYTFTTKDAAGQGTDETDSDADLNTGFTGCYTLTAGETDNSVDAGMYVVQQDVKADLSLTKTVNNSNPQNGDNVTYRITVTNNGPANATGVAVTDLLPQGLDFVSAAPSAGSYNNTTGVWTVGNLANGASATLDITVKVNAGTLTTSTVDLGVASGFNLFVLEDLTQPSADTQGRVAVGRDATLSYYSVGDQLTGTAPSDVLIVGRNLTYTSGAVYNGNVVYGNSTNLPQPGVSIEGTLKQGTPIDFDAAKTYLRNLSTQLAGNTVNGTTKMEWGGLTLTGTTPLLNVFSVSGSDLSNANSVAINVPNGAVVLVNISGTEVSWTGGLTVNGTDISNVLYNFYQATKLTIQGIDVRGSILAPFADVNFAAGVVNGQMIAKSVTGAGQFNHSKFIGNIPSEKKINNIAEITAAVENDPDSTPGNGISTEDDYAKVLITINGNTGSGNTGGSGQTGSGNWQHVTDFTAGEMVWKLTVDNSGNVLAGTWGGKIYKTTDNGKTWNIINSGMKTGFIWSIVVNSSGSIFAGTERGIFRSADNGATWEEAGLQGKDVRSMAIEPNTNVLYAGTWGTGIFKSTNNGSSWTEINKGLSNLAVHALAISNSGELYAGTFGAGVFESNDHGTNWTNLNAGYNFIWALGVTSTGTVYAGTYGDGVYTSANGGNTWTKVNSGLTSMFIYSITVDASDNVYLSSWAGGVFASSANSGSWNAMGMAGLGVSSVAVNPVTGGLFVGTGDGAIYLSTSSLTDVKTGKKEIPTSFELKQNYPNPFNPSTAIQFSIPSAGQYSLKVYDILGKEIAVLANDQFTPGVYTVHFQAGNLASGIYLCHLQGNNVNLVRKMLLMK